MQAFLSSLKNHGLHEITKCLYLLSNKNSLKTNTYSFDEATKIS